MNFLSKNYLQTFFMLFFLLLSIRIINNQSELNINNLDLDFTHVLELLNGNIFIIHKYGVMVYNYNFTIVLYNYNFGGITLINSEKENNLTSLIQCEDATYKYLVSIIYNKIYVFSSRGQYLFHESNDFFSDFSDELVFKSYSFLFYKNDGNNYYFILAFVNTEKNIKLIKFKIDMSNKSIYIEKNYVHSVTNHVTDVVSCQIINTNLYPNTLGCFYFKYYQYKYNLFIPLFDLENDFELKNETNYLSIPNGGQHFFIKSTLGDNKNLAYICFVTETQSINLFAFDFDLFEFSTPKSYVSCNSGTKFIDIKYFKFINEFLYSCKGTESIAIMKFKGNYNITQIQSSEDLNDQKISSISHSKCDIFYNYDLIFLTYEAKYNLVTNFHCNITTCQVYIFPDFIQFNKTNYVKPSEEPDSSFFNSPIITTILPPISIPTNTTIPTTISIPKTTIPFSLIKTTFPNTHSTIFTPMKSTFPTTLIKTTTFTTIYKSFRTTTLTTFIISSTILNSHKHFISTIFPSSLKTTIPFMTQETINTSIVSTSINKILISSTIQKIIPTTSLIKYNLFSPGIIKDYDCKLKCSKCSEDSTFLNLCIKCNTNEKYYPSIIIGYDFVECYNEETKPINYFFNKKNKYYEPCYSNCKTCNYLGNDEINNCTSCKHNYIFRPDKIKTSNCVVKCQYYYYISFDQYFCTDNNQCPAEAPLLIRDKGRCIDNCFNDNEFNYQFNYECYNQCPNDTNADEEFICRLKNKKKCYLYTDYFSNIKYEDLESNNFYFYINRYIDGFNDTDFHVDFYKSKNYTITIYKTMECLKELEMNSTIIDFGECYEKVQKKYNFVGRNLIILIADFFNDKKLENTLFYFFNPDTGKILPIEEVCKDQSFTIEKSLTYYSEINIKQAKFFESQDINIFNRSDVFYNDLCFSFESPNKKDVPLKERILLFYPNVTLCDESCNNVGVNLTTMKAICKCTLKQLLEETKDASKLVGLDFANLIDRLSIEVIKCYKTIFKLKNFIKCYGGFICITLIICQSICAFIIVKISIYKIRKNTFSIVESYSNFLKSQKNINFPPKITNKLRASKISLNEKNNSKKEIKIKEVQANLKSPLKSQKDLLIHHKINTKFSRKKTKYTKNGDVSSFQLKDETNIKEYLITSLDELDYDELVVKENRKFCRMFCDRLISSQMIFDLFYNNNWIIPKSIKIIFIIVMIDLHIFVNALFYNEDYITDLYYLDKKETLLSFVPRSINRIIYTTVASGFLDFIISLLFPAENKIKRILIRKKNNIKEMKMKVFLTMKNIINNYLIFIALSYIITIFSWYFISCFNNVYPYLKIEWIKSSIFIIIVIQFMSFLRCFSITILRIISIKCKSEKIYRISNYFLS